MKFYGKFSTIITSFALASGPTGLCETLSSAEPINLAHYEKSIYSQNGEDGVTDAIFRLIGTSSKYYVEFGAGDGTRLSNTKNLRKHGWHGLLMEYRAENPTINLRCEFITAENINTLFMKYDVPYDLDLLSIDIDYNDFYVWKALDEKYKPRLIIVEYNSSLLPHEDKVVPYHASHIYDGTNYFGASILAYYQLGRKKGYSLVYAEKAGLNLFFVRDDLIEKIPGSFKNINNVAKLYVPLNPKFGIQQDPYKRPYVSSKEQLTK